MGQSVIYGAARNSLKISRLQRTEFKGKMVGPVGLEPTTNGL